MITEQSSSLLLETVAFLNDGMRMSQHARSSRPAFPPAEGRSRCSRRRGRVRPIAASWTSTGRSITNPRVRSIHRA
jgi:hypothetical protein